MAANRLVRASARLLRALGKGDAAIVGGMAVNAYGYLRATRDVDVIVNLPLAEARRRLEQHGIATTLLRGDVRDGDFSCLKGVLGRPGREAVPFDILPPLVPLDPTLFVEVEVAGQTLVIVDLPGLLRLKLRAGGVKDLYDIAVLASLRPELRKDVDSLAADKPVELKHLRTMIADPRTHDAVAEIRRQESATRRPSKPRARRRG
jgi:hypothetical protein